MELTEEKLAELIEKVKAGEKVKLFDQDELNGKIKARLEKETPKVEKAAEQIAQLQGQLEKLQNKVKEEKAAAELEGKTELEKQALELAKYKDALESIRKEKKAAEERAAAIHKARKDDFLVQSISSLLLKADRFNKDAIKAAVLEARTEFGNVLEVAENKDGKFSLKASTPDLDQADPAELIKSFVAARSYYQTARPGGGSADPSGRGGTTTPADWKAGLDDAQQWAQAFNEWAVTDGKASMAGAPDKKTE